MVTIGDSTNYQKGQYTAYNAPYCVSSAPCNTYTRGVDYADFSDVRPFFFPARSTLRWSWPAGRSTIAGYMELIFGNYDSSVPKIAVPPVQVGSISNFTEDWSISLTGNPLDYNVLSEFYCTTVAGNANTKAEEVGFFYNISDIGLTYFNGATLVGTWNDGVTTWTVRTKADGSAGHYIMFYAGGQRLSGHVDRKAAMQWLVAQGQVDPTHYINGTAIGSEVVRRSGSMTVAGWSEVLN